MAIHSSLRWSFPFLDLLPLPLLPLPLLLLLVLLLLFFSFSLSFPFCFFSFFFFFIYFSRFLFSFFFFRFFSFFLSTFFFHFSSSVFFLFSFHKEIGYNYVNICTFIKIVKWEVGVRVGGWGSGWLGGQWWGVGIYRDENLCSLIIIMFVCLYLLHWQKGSITHKEYEHKNTTLKKKRWSPIRNLIKKPPLFKSWSCIFFR